MVLSSPRRIQTRNLTLLPAVQPSHRVKTYGLFRWTFGRGSVVRQVWPSVLMHTLLAAIVTAVTMTTSFELAIPNVMMTVLGVVLGFVISYRAASGYDRYFMGRTSWGDIIKNARILGTLIWYHVPPCLTPRTAEERTLGTWKRPKEELRKVMREKKVALKLIEGFAVATKHHIRGEPGIYYADLYDLVLPLQPQIQESQNGDTPFANIGDASASTLAFDLDDDFTNSPVVTIPVIPSAPVVNNPVTPSISEHVAQERASKGKCKSKEQKSRPLLKVTPTGPAKIISDYRLDSAGPHQGQWQAASKPHLSTSKYRPRVACEGLNLPLEVLRCLSEWFSVLEDRGTVPGTSMGSLMGCISSFEDSLTTIEKILTVPLPYAYSVHINTVWVYLFFLPFQLVDMFGWYSIIGVMVASFIYLGFVAAGEELEQPFGYDENDLDIDLFCREIIHADLHQLQKMPCTNAYMGPQRREKIRHRTRTVTEAVGSYEKHAENSDDVDSSSSDGSSSDDSEGMQAEREVVRVQVVGSAATSNM
ncbi:hypothetical protein D9758_002933 [Tetrapyrgos nigripes]|uniref:Uncharacterized protein n=1 Tax=Tetrapyrgos nigripes TaxID=182062 RepID=A0A8H5LTN9_9AGAR|nr:hypothetical protein D9758_002933 [Tetrapyrgos nigripes]